MVKRKILICTALAALASVVIVSAVALPPVYHKYVDNKRPNFKEDVEIYVREGDTAEDVLAQIPDGSVKDSRSLERSLRANISDDRLLPGHYVAEAGKPSVYLPRMLANGWQTPVNLVLSGTMRSKEVIARKIAGQMMIDSAAVYSALNDDALLGKFGFTSRNAFSLIIPDTYQMYWTASAEDIFTKLKSAYDAFWTAENIEKAKKQGLSKEEVSVLASIVKAESNHEPEYPSIAGVYLNRLKQGMRLQADPTVAFCYGYKLNRILYSHLQVDSPYNTYLHEGLPPGPICVPDRASLEAVLNPDRHGYLYFCASPEMDGTHRFAKTLSEHNRNARAFQRALDTQRK